MSLESQLDVLEDALPPTSRFVAWIDAMMRGDEELARKLEQGGERVQTAFTWKPFGFYVHAGTEVAMAVWSELHVTHQLFRTLTPWRSMMVMLLDRLEYAEWSARDEEEREACDAPEPEEHRLINILDEKQEQYLQKLAAQWRGFERFAHGEGFDARMMLYAFEFPSELMEDIEEIVELVADVQVPTERVEFTRRMLLAIYATKLGQLSADQCETRAYVETIGNLEADDG